MTLLAAGQGVERVCSETLYIGTASKESHTGSPRPEGRCAEGQDAKSQVALDRNEALRGPPPGAVERVRTAIARGHIYPHEAVARATEAAAAHLGVEPRQVVLTNGVDEATDLSVLELGDPWTVTPGFDGYGDRALALNHRPRAYALTAEHALPRGLIEATSPGQLVALSSPNNPTANAFAPESLRELLERGAHLLLDETYADFSTEAPGLRWLAEYPRLTVFRSFSKAYGLAGLRIGCLVGEEQLIARLRARQAYLTTSGLAAEALVGALESDPDFPGRHAREVRALREELIARLRALALFERVYDSETNFVFVKCASAEEASGIRETLAAHGNVIVASTAPLGEPAGLRIGVSLQGDTDRLVAGLTEIKGVRDGAGPVEGPRESAGRNEHPREAGSTKEPPT
jgi:histidinol-phosphate aminotransferase